MRRRHRFGRGAPAFATLVIVLAGCGTPTVEDPLAALTAPESGPRMQLAAMDELDAQSPPDEAYVEALHRAVWRAGYTPDVRVAAARRLDEIDHDALMKTLRQRLPNMNAWEGLTRLCELIGDEGWVELTPALVSSWARPVVGTPDDERPEYLALVELHGANRVQDVVFELFASSRKVSEQGLRTRCWDLMHRLGDRERLVALLASEDGVPADDAFLLDLQAGAVELGIVPYNREEILWLRKLRQPERRAFWDEAREAIAGLPPGRAHQIEMRDLTVVVAAARHDPEMLAARETDLYARLEAQLRGRKRYAHGSDFGGFRTGRDRLHDWRDELTWGDLAAILLILRALDIRPQVVEHLFDFAQRDRADETTEYGGVIALDRQGRFEIREFPPRVRHHDQKFLASQAMLDAGYTALFHFHYHVQKPRNEEYAGPGFGDVNYADNTRANCLVLTSVRKDAMNIDFYRHSRLLVDLGVIEADGRQVRGDRAPGERVGARVGRVAP